MGRWGYNRLMADKSPLKTCIAKSSPLIPHDKSNDQVSLVEGTNNFAKTYECLLNEMVKLYIKRPFI